MLHRLTEFRQELFEMHQTTIDRLDDIITELLEEQLAPPSEAGVKLDIPWLSQLGDGANYAPGDCGPAVLAMWLNFLGHTASVDDVSRATNKAQGFHFTTVGDLNAAAVNWGLLLTWSKNRQAADLYRQLDAGRPVIALVYYPALPVRYDPKYPWCHWVLVVGYGDDNIIYHDPYYKDGQGAFVEISEQAFMSAWGQNYRAGNSNRQMLSEV